MFSTEHVHTSDTYTHTCTIHVHVQHVHIHMYMYVCTHTHTHIHTHIRSHTHTLCSNTNTTWVREAQGVVQYQMNKYHQHAVRRSKTRQLRTWMLEGEQSYAHLSNKPRDKERYYGEKWSRHIWMGQCAYMYIRVRVRVTSPKCNWSESVWNCVLSNYTKHTHTHTHTHPHIHTLTKHTHAWRCLRHAA